MSRLDRDHFIEAVEAERRGNLTAAANHLRAHHGKHEGDGAARVRLARILVALAEPASARRILAPVDRGGDATLARQANRVLAALDEAEGALTSARIRWERLLADDIDDPEARARLRALSPDSERFPAGLELATLVSPEGVKTARFQIVRELGRGTTATVYLVRDEALALPLALKVLHPQMASASHAGARARFFAEARLAARLRHPGVVAIYDVDDEARYLAMEYVAGGTLRERVRAGAATDAGGVAPEEALATARSLLDALAYVHGDLKPGNVLIRRPGEIVIADFGVAALGAAGGADARGADDRPVGTPLYLAPEQFHGAPATPRTDLFATGAILWELVAGRPARRQTDLLHAAGPAEIPPLAPGRLLPLGATGVRLAALVTALLANAPEQRPESAAAARASLA